MSKELNAFLLLVAIVGILNFVPLAVFLLAENDPELVITVAMIVCGILLSVLGPMLDFEFVTVYGFAGMFIAFKFILVRTYGGQPEYELLGVAAIVFAGIASIYAAHKMRRDYNLPRILTVCTILALFFSMANTLYVLI